MNTGSLTQRTWPHMIQHQLQTVWPPLFPQKSKIFLTERVDKMVITFDNLHSYVYLYDIRIYKLSLFHYLRHCLNVCLYTSFVVIHIEEESSV